MWTASPTNIAAQGVTFGNGTFVIIAGHSIYQSDPVLQLEMVAPGTLRLASPFANCVIEGAEDLTAPVLWQTLTNIFVTNSPILWHDNQATNRPQRFYRARLQP